MDFSLNEEQLQAQKMVRDFALKEVIPVIGEWDHGGSEPDAGGM